MANELKATVINMKTLSQDITDPVVVGAGDAAGRALRIIFTQEAAAQFTEGTKVYLSWWHQEKNIKGYNVFTEIIDEDDEDFPPTWEIHYPKSMLFEGNVLACIQIVDEVSIATSVNFTIHVLIDSNNGSSFVGTDDFTEFQNAVIKLASVEDQARKQMIDQKIEFEDMQLAFMNVQKVANDSKDIAEEAKQISERSLEKAENALDITNEFSNNVSDMIETFDETIQKITNDTAVTITKTIGGSNDSYAYRYIFNQGGIAISNGIIDISKDMVATNGELVHPTTKNPIIINGQQVSSGTYIAMTIANGNTFYINVADLIEYNSVSNTDEIILSDANHTITATVGEIAASKIRYTKDKTVAQAINTLESAIGTGGSVDQKIQTAIETLDANKVAINGNIITGIHQTDGKIDFIDEIALTAQNVAYGTSNVKAALDTIGTIPATATATTVVDYVDEKTGSGVAALNADLDAALSATDTDTEAVAVVTGITEVEGVLTAVDSIAADKAGAATRAKAAVVGQSGDATSADTIYGAKAYADAAIANLDADLDAATDATITDTEKVAVVTGVTEVDGVITAVDSFDVDKAGAATRAKNAVIGSTSDDANASTIYGAKAYADSVIGSAVADLDADLDASGTAQHAGVFVMSGITQTNGKLTTIDSTEVEIAGAAATAEQNAKNYANNLLTWGSLA